jgi:hypothetical protein
MESNQIEPMQRQPRLRPPLPSGSVMTLRREDAGDVLQHALQHGGELLALDDRVLEGAGEGQAEFADGVGGALRTALHTLLRPFQLLHRRIASR